MVQTPRFHARHALRGRHADRQPRGRHVAGLRMLREVTLIAAEDTRRTAQLLRATRSRHRPPASTSTTRPGRRRPLSSGCKPVTVDCPGFGRRHADFLGSRTAADPGGHRRRHPRRADSRSQRSPGSACGVGLPTDTFTFLGFPPTRASDRERWLSDVRSAGRTVVFFEAPHRIRQTLQDLLHTLGDPHVVVGRELTKVHEELVRGPISGVLAALGEPRGEYTGRDRCWSINRHEAAETPGGDRDQCSIL